MNNDIIIQSKSKLGRSGSAARLLAVLPLALTAIGVAACSAASPHAARFTPAAKREPAQTIAALPVEKANTPASPDRNPFEGAAFFVDPYYAQKVQSSAELVPALSKPMAVVKQQPTALWLDRIAAVEQVPGWLDAAQSQGQTLGKPAVPVMVVYNLPNRDCAAKASNGELSISEGGEQRYRSEYIDVIAEHLADVPEQRVAIVLEPDSLPNMISNLGVEKCAVSQEVYVHSVAYAISRLSLPNVSIYLDVAHAGWLGWEANQRRMVDLVVKVLDMAGGPSRIRGFASNVANYNAISGDFGKRLEPSNPAGNELDYVHSFLSVLEERGVGGKSFLIDTSRNGKADIRTRWGNWCNIAGAGIGERPTVAPTGGVDAYFWVKPPGDSDGTADRSAARFDENCASTDATPGAPEAGQWFHDYFVELVKNANPAL